MTSYIILTSLISLMFLGYITYSLLNPEKF
ncbi:MAG: K(+)-transporting ATPase subunit F [Phototrophicaceae bacterium]|jgi:hypothetical protein